MKGVLEWTDEEFHLLSSGPPIAVELGNCSPEPPPPAPPSESLQRLAILKDALWETEHGYDAPSLECCKWAVSDTPHSSHYWGNMLHAGSISCSQVQLQCQGSLSFYPRLFFSFFFLSTRDVQRNSSDFQASATQKCMGVTVLGLPWRMHDRWSCIIDFPLDVGQSVLWAVVLGSSEVETKQALVAQGSDQNLWCWFSSFLTCILGYFLLLSITF